MFSQRYIASLIPFRAAAPKKDEHYISMLIKISKHIPSTMSIIRTYNANVPSSTSTDCNSFCLLRGVLSGAQQTPQYLVPDYDYMAISMISVSDQLTAIFLNKICQSGKTVSNVRLLNVLNEFSNLVCLFLGHCSVLKKRCK